MPDIATTLKAEIARIARKEIRSETADMKRASAQHRAQVSALRRRIDSLERELKRASKQREPRAAPTAAGPESAVPRRFSAVRLAATRKKLNVSAADFGALVGVSGQSIYKWEAGEARPRARQLEAIAAIRGIGKRQLAERLQAVGGKRSSP
ncbi:MAG: helix-turn-helix domain protein [Ramlibacter sp.]|jgi:DNA-binding transcriptional regulator YiaG|nr:helix-turn-helix domain protein [Ramlibacter sp.]MDB5913536.1 helix-turn-helix domain protein [Ramlibacter sp.]